MMDLSKVYGCLPHVLLVAKLAAYVFNNTSLVLIIDYLKNHLQRVQIGLIFSSYLKFFRDAPQG